MLLYHHEAVNKLFIFLGCLPSDSIDGLGCRVC